MKKRLLLFIIGLFMISPIGVRAANRIYNIKMDIYIDANGNAKINEIWDVDGDDGTEWYKTMYNMGNSVISDYMVSMDNQELKKKNWDVDESLDDKKGYYGINETSEGPELCFGKYDYKRHTFTLTYNVSNYVINTEDSQVLYWTLIPKLSDVDFDKFSVTVHSDISYLDTLDVWGYGYKGYAYVKDGKIEMSTEENSDMNDKYVVLLVKYPLNTFASTNTYSSFNTFEDVHKMAEGGTFEYDYDNEPSFWENVVAVITSIFPFALIGFGIFATAKGIAASKYGFINNKVVNKNTAPMFRDIPCNKNIYYANTLINLNGMGYKESNILGAIILKWVRNDKIKFVNVTSGIFNKETSAIDLTLKPTFDNLIEKELFDVMYEASKDGILEPKELEKWCKNHYSEYLSLFKQIVDGEKARLEGEGHIRKRINKNECKYQNVMDDMLYEDSKQLFGLEQYLREFSRMDTKEVMEVKLWDEYLMFAYLFGIADKVAKQLKNMYPTVLEQANFDYDTIIFVNNLSYSSVLAASNARSAAESYSSGGGGFSSGGGGGGSFGGGGGGGSR